MSEIKNLADAIAVLKGADDGGSLSGVIRLLEEELEQAIRLANEARATFGCVTEIKM